ncbi:intradiol ring-cleavage dioxygenase [Frankia sp. Cppng1_Ct_nod]|uniref:intradiol ring-cleavage dioxygenase n=1 Tax=Frankia sp. Cppng1_Ct_nod TaxID=2897162 RepID=UPI0010418D65|nr:intradiol ring-cleavage dioxygenase [Frankia sp. Cppng1_Ct_nod]
MTNRHDSGEFDNGQISQALLSRRRLLGLSGVGIAAIGLGVAGCGTGSGGGAAAQNVTASPSVSSAALLTAEEMEGPYYLDYELFRSDITEGKPGVPLTLRLNVVDVISGGLLKDAVVEIWQCDALGVYSGYTKAGAGGGVRPTGIPTGIPTGAFPSGGLSALGAHQQPTDKLTYLRGSQISDSRGSVDFQSIFPGWYASRAIHIHTKVHVDGRRTSTGYEGGHVCHTGQLYFAEDMVAKIKVLSPYVTNTVVRTTLDQDNIYRAAGGGTRAGLLQLAQRDDQHIDKGVIASLTLGVDPSRTNTGEDGSTMAQMRPPGVTPSAT